MNNKNKLNKAIDRLASLYEYGQLQLSTNPSDFLDTVSDDILRLRALEKGKQLADKDKWWRTLLINEENISDIVSRFTPDLIGEFSVAIHYSNKKEALRIMEEALNNAPDESFIDSIPGWNVLCDLCADG